MKPEQITSATLQLRQERIAPVAETVGMKLLPDSAIRTPPLVLLLGNHSSGKSSLINHLLDRKVQRTGIAPTDDGFTVLMHAEHERNVDGQALVTNSHLPFGDLATFGPGLVQHLEGRGLPADLLKHILLIDSPGMIDAAGAETERPYDFQQVVRWFAEQADLILLFFDPEKPGTTGETLSTLTEALVGIDHKLRIVMNKMDLFEGIRDFARTYGALCWNLSRSLQVKDMPHIYTTVIPDLVRDECALPLEGFAAALLELESYIADLPARRADSVLSRVLEEGENVQMHVRVLDVMRHRVRGFAKRTFAVVLLLTLAGAALTWWLATYGPDATWYAQGPIIGATITLVLLLLCWWLPRRVARWRRTVGVERLDDYFQEAYRRDLIQRDRANDLMHRWSQVRPHLRKVLSSRTDKPLPRISKRRRRHLAEVVGRQLPELRA
ncbi:MAG: dynamin family protein [Planctomycetota bacterium]